MYGLLIESLSEYLIAKYGEEVWDTIRKSADVSTATFSVQQVYSEAILPRIVSCASKLLDVDERALMEAVGVHFVNFVSRYGYDQMLAVLGRHLRDFLNGLDNLHEYFRFSYPRMLPPSFFCEDETKDGLTLHYRTRRRGYLHYTIGQIKAVGELFYQTPVQISIVEEEMQANILHVVMNLNFDNTAFDDDAVVILHEETFLPIQARVVFELFPFCIVFTPDLEICVLGSSLHTIMTDALGRKISDVFALIRPTLEFTWTAVLTRTNNVFELSSIDPIQINKSGENRLEALAFKLNSFTELKERQLQLKGQMLFVSEWNAVIYLGTPVMQDLDAMIEVGLYINDLSMHDFSRDLMLAGTQQSVELKLALDQEQKKSKRLEDSMKKLDEEMKRTDELLYQMIPKEVANRLREGQCSVATCETFDHVTILFSDVVTFTEMCSRITPMEVVTVLNMMYSLFDNLTERHDIYKVETIGDAYMVVAGCPQRVDNHATRICDMALDMCQVITGIKDPSTNKNIRIRVGIHSGNVVAGVVGVKMPRYCLFGDAVNTTSRMESTSEAMKIQISTETKNLLPPMYKVENRGTVTLKGKGRVKTFWLTGKDGYQPPAIGIEGLGGISVSASPLYSPVMSGENILERDSLAYSVLSNFSTPNNSRPVTATKTRGNDELIDPGSSQDSPKKSIVIPTIAITETTNSLASSAISINVSESPPTPRTEINTKIESQVTPVTINPPKVIPTREVPLTTSPSMSVATISTNSAVTVARSIQTATSSTTSAPKLATISNIISQKTSTTIAPSVTVPLPQKVAPVVVVSQQQQAQEGVQVSTQMSNSQPSNEIAVPESNIQGIPPRIVPVARKPSRDFESMPVPVQKWLKPQFDVAQQVPAVHCSFQCQSSTCLLQ